VAHVGEINLDNVRCMDSCKKVCVQPQQPQDQHWTAVNDIKYTSLLNYKVFVTNHGGFFFPPENNNRNYTKTALVSPCRKGRHNTKPVSYYGSNKVEQFRNIILKSAFLIIPKVTINWVKSCVTSNYTTLWNTTWHS